MDESMGRVPTTALESRGTHRYEKESRQTFQ